MKAILEFNIPEDNFLHKKSLQGLDLNSAIREFDNDLRSMSKHGHDFKNADEAISQIRLILQNHLSNYNINIYED